jgi:hypothetical protein
MKTRTTRTGAAITPSEIRDLATPLTGDASLDPLLASIEMPDSFFCSAPSSGVSTPAVRIKIESKDDMRKRCLRRRTVLTRWP